MNRDEELNYDAFVEAYCLLSSYIREEGKIGANYNMDHLKYFVKFMAETMTDPECFDTDINLNPVRNKDGSLIVPTVTEHDGTGLA
jgi:hypothetical protein